jgi:hypothetical protein
MGEIISATRSICKGQLTVIATPRALLLRPLGARGGGGRLLAGGRGGGGGSIGAAVGRWLSLPPPAATQLSPPIRIVNHAQLSYQAHTELITVHAFNGRRWRAGPGRPGLPAGPRRCNSGCRGIPRGPCRILVGMFRLLQCRGSSGRARTQCRQHSASSCRPLAIAWGPQTGTAGP